MIRIEDDGHDVLFRFLTGADKAAETDDFREGFVAGKTADYLLVPRLRFLTEDRSAQFRQFLLHARQPGFQLFGGGRHISHYRRSTADGKSLSPLYTVRTS